MSSRKRKKLTREIAPRQPNTFTINLPHASHLLEDKAEPTWEDIEDAMEENRYKGCKALDDFALAFQKRLKEERSTPQSSV